MALAKTATGAILITSKTPQNTDPDFIFTKHHQIHEPKFHKVWPVFPPIPPTKIDDIWYRTASLEDLNIICDFTDFWMGGKGYTAKVPGAGRDYFIPKKQHITYLKLYTVLLAFGRDKLVGWAVRQREGVLIHLLVASDYRGRGIGARLLKQLNPPIIRSKSDQSTGDPLNFYLKHGYKKTSDQKTGNHQNIDVLTRE